MLAAVFVGVTLVCGYGWTWLGPTALHIPTELRVAVDPLGLAGRALLPPAPPARHPGDRLGGGHRDPGPGGPGHRGWPSCGCWSPSAGTRWSGRLGLALILIVVGSPTVWPWYLMWGLVLLAATTAQRSKVLAVVAGLAMLVVGSERPSPARWALVPRRLPGGRWRVRWLVRGRRWKDGGGRTCRLSPPPHRRYRRAPGRPWSGARPPAPVPPRPDAVGWRRNRPASMARAGWCVRPSSSTWPRGLITWATMAVTTLVTHRSILEEVDRWDSRWFLRAAVHGWPSHLPYHHGHVAGSTIAFFPLFP